MGAENSPRIECFRCGICCTMYQPKITPGEAEALAAHLSLSLEDFISRYVIITKIGFLLRQSRGRCVFLGCEGHGKYTCTVYEARPAPCRDWQAGLSRRECMEGLAGLADSEMRKIVADASCSAEEAEKFIASLCKKGK